MVKNKIVELRLAADRAINSFVILVPFHSHEIQLAKDNFLRAKNWLGKVLGELGESHPYKESFDPSNNEIAEQTDHTTEVAFTKEIYEAGHIAMIKSLRLYVQEWEVQFRSVVTNDEAFAELANSTAFGLGFYEEALKGWIEAGMWLGNELHEVNERAKLEQKQAAAPSLILPANG